MTLQQALKDASIIKCHASILNIYENKNKYKNSEMIIKTLQSKIKNLES